MLKEMRSVSAEPATLFMFDLNATDDELQLSIGRIAAQLRKAGHVETAHFMDVAALVLQDSQPG